MAFQCGDGRHRLHFFACNPSHTNPTPRVPTCPRPHTFLHNTHARTASIRVQRGVLLLRTCVLLRAPTACPTRSGVRCGAPVGVPPPCADEPRGPAHRPAQRQQSSAATSSDGLWGGRSVGVVHAPSPVAAGAASPAEGVSCQPKTARQNAGAIPTYLPSPAHAMCRRRVSVHAFGVAVGLAIHLVARVLLHFGKRTAGSAGPCRQLRRQVFALFLPPCST
jgi:hypothetical protein